jgi:threonine dehydratase
LVRVYACEPETGAPVTASLAAGEPRSVDYRASFVDGAGAKALLPAMWERTRTLLAGAYAISLDDTAAAIRLLVERAHVVAEGAGALSVAVALSGLAGTGRVVCIVSGGNIDPARLAAILQGRTPD